jgi:hypothetical protein
MFKFCPYCCLFPSHDHAPAVSYTLKYTSSHILNNCKWRKTSFKPCWFLTIVTTNIAFYRNHTNRLVFLRETQGVNKGRKNWVLPVTCHEGTEGEEQYSATLSLTLALDWGGWSTPRAGRFTPGKDTWYPFYRRLDESQGQSGQVRKISPPPEFEPQTFQPLERRYNDNTIPAQVFIVK